MEKGWIINYVNNATIQYKVSLILGYEFIPHTLFQLKEWQKYDISRYIEVDSVPIGEGIGTIDLGKDEIFHSTIE